MKPSELQLARSGNLPLTGADTLVDEAIKLWNESAWAPTLVWHQQAPVWMHTLNRYHREIRLSEQEESPGEYEKSSGTVMEHFGDRVISWDVVHEAMVDNPPKPKDWKRASLRKIPWYHAIGEGTSSRTSLRKREVLDEHLMGYKLIIMIYNLDNRKRHRPFTNYGEGDLMRSTRKPIRENL